MPRGGVKQGRGIGDAGSSEWGRQQFSIGWPGKECSLGTCKQRAEGGEGTRQMDIREERGQ